MSDPLPVNIDASMVGLNPTAVVALPEVTEIGYTAKQGCSTQCTSI